MNAEDENINFTECVLLPVKEYSKLRELDKTKHIKTGTVHDIVSNNQLSDTMKLKLLNHVSLAKGQISTSVAPKKVDKRWEHLLPHFSDRSAAERIFQQIEQKTEHLNWNQNSLEIIVNNRNIDGTNIVKLIQYFLKETIVTSETDKPKAYKLFGNALIDIGVLPSWVKQPLKRSRRKRDETVSSPSNRRNVRRRATVGSWEEY